MVRRLTIAYRGTVYSGWQRQANSLTVQEVVERALAKLAGESLQVIAASRTDAGVHARGQVAHLKGAESLPERALLHGTNRHLPVDVRIVDTVRVADDFHARKHAVSKLYSYRMIATDVLSPVDSLFGVRVDEGIDLALMRAACDHLVGEHDFSAFALAGGSHRSSSRRIFSATLEERGAEIRFLVRGNGFLRGMVRSLVGTLIEVGSNRRQPGSLEELLLGAPRSAAGPTAPARGLMLERVDYDPRWETAESGDTGLPVVD